MHKNLNNKCNKRFRGYLLLHMAIFKSYISLKQAVPYLKIYIGIERNYFMHLKFFQYIFSLQTPAKICYFGWKFL